MELDLIVKNATIVTAAEILPDGLSIGVIAGKIACIAQTLRPSAHTKVIDAEGAYVTPGGVDSHCHIAQDNAPSGDTWETGSRSAIAGGNTTLLAFASQKRHETSLLPVVEEYHRRSQGQAYCDYGFHLILSNPTENILTEELPTMMAEGISSVKLYMTYEPLKLGDDHLMEVMMRARTLGMTTMIHCENSEMIEMISKRLIGRGHTAPEFHATARPQIAETEATYRAISLASLCDTPILIVHMSSEAAVKHVQRAQRDLLPIHAETCPHYLYLLANRLNAPDWEGSKCVCAPPLRHHESDLQFLWDSVANGVITVWSSDHAPSKFNHPLGKQKPLHSGSIPVFNQIPNGLPGLETRLPLLFTAATGENPKLSLPKFVALTSTNPAKIYGLNGVKGSIAPGYDADLTIWYPQGKGRTTISNGMLHHDIDYTPFEGQEVENWPRWTVLRGNVIWDRDAGGIVGAKGQGEFLKRGRGQMLVGRTGKEAQGMKSGERSLWANEGDVPWRAL